MLLIKYSHTYKTTFTTYEIYVIPHCKDTFIIGWFYTHSAWLQLLRKKKHVAALDRIWWWYWGTLNSNLCISIGANPSQSVVSKFRVVFRIGNILSPVIAKCVNVVWIVVFSFAYIDAIVVIQLYIRIRTTGRVFSCGAKLSRFSIPSSVYSLSSTAKYRVSQSLSKRYMETLSVRCERAFVVCLWFQFHINI